MMHPMRLLFTSSHLEGVMLHSVFAGLGTGKTGNCALPAVGSELYDSTSRLFSNLADLK